MFDWTKIPHTEKLSPHFTVGEWTRGVPHGYLNIRNVDPLMPLAVTTVAELARIEFNKLIDLLPAEKRNDHPRGITISSGVRTPSTNRGASKSRHKCGVDYVADDFRPQGNWNACVIEYDDFYGCFIRALDHVAEPFGLGYYSRTKAGIHIDCSFDLRASQHKAQIRPWIDKEGFHYMAVIDRGYRWGPNGFSFRGNEDELFRLHNAYHDPAIEPKPWIEHARELNVNLDLIHGPGYKPAQTCCK